MREGGRRGEEGVQVSSHCDGTKTLVKPFWRAWERRCAGRLRVPEEM